MTSTPPEAQGNRDPNLILRRQKRGMSPATWFSMLLGLALVGAVGWFAWTAGLFASRRVVPPKTDATMIDKRAVAVRNTLIRGTDSKGRPYSLKARNFLRSDTNKRIIHLTDVIGEIVKTDGHKVTVFADAADYDRDKEQAVLRNNVRIREEGRYTLFTSKAVVDVNKKELSSAEPVTVELSGGHIEARGVLAGENMDHVHFPGPVHAQFDSPEAETEAAPEADTAGEKDKGAMPPQQEQN